MNTKEIEWFAENVLQFVPTFTEEIQITIQTNSEEQLKEKIERNSIRLNNATIALTECSKLKKLCFETVNVIETLSDYLSNEISYLKRNEFKNGL